MRQICITVAERAPEFGFGNFLAELLQDAQNWEILLIGLRALISLLLAAPTRLQASHKPAADVEVPPSPLTYLPVQRHKSGFLRDVIARVFRLIN